MVRLLSALALTPLMAADPDPNIVISFQKINKIFSNMNMQNRGKYRLTPINAEDVIAMPDGTITESPQPATDELSGEGLNYGVSCGGSPVTRVIGGTAGDLTNLPYQVYLQLSANGEAFFSCGGTIINPNWILTAAHCTSGMSTGLSAVIYGIESIAGPLFAENYATVERFVDHPSFVYISLINDISLVETTTALIMGDKVRPACLPSVQLCLEEGTSVTASGWGNTNSGDDDSVSLTVNTIELPIASHSLCLETYNNVDQNVLCAGGVAGQDTCQGDSGGPLVYENAQGVQVIYGVVSSGSDTCGEDGVPAVYTRVTEYLDWINDVSGVHMVEAEGSYASDDSCTDTVTTGTWASLLSGAGTTTTEESTTTADTTTTEETTTTVETTTVAENTTTVEPTTVSRQTRTTTAAYDPCKKSFVTMDFTPAEQQYKAFRPGFGVSRNDQYCLNLPGGAVKTNQCHKSVGADGDSSQWEQIMIDETAGIFQVRSKRNGLCWENTVGQIINGGYTALGQETCDSSNEYQLWQYRFGIFYQANKPGICISNTAQSRHWDFAKVGKCRMSTFSGYVTDEDSGECVFHAKAKGTVINSDKTIRMMDGNCLGIKSKNGYKIGNEPYWSTLKDNGDGVFHTCQVNNARNHWQHNADGTIESLATQEPKPQSTKDSGKRLCLTAKKAGCDIWGNMKVILDECTGADTQRFTATEHGQLMQTACVDHNVCLYAQHNHMMYELDQGKCTGGGCRPIMRLGMCRASMFGEVEHNE